MFASKNMSRPDIYTGTRLVDVVLTEPLLEL